MADLMENYTLIIPTYNRSEKLKVLLSFLENTKCEFPIIVADSSASSHRLQNKESVTSSSLKITYVEFDSSLNPFQKFFQATEHVNTAFCSLCADDDVIDPGSLSEITNFLEASPDHAAAHGYYYSFLTNPHNVVTDLCYYSHSNNNDDPIHRLSALFGRYEALTYAVYRTSILQDILKEVQSLDSLLGHELLSGALTVIAGKVARLPVIYMGRSVGPSHSYSNWHPIEMLFSNPDHLYHQYGKYHQILAEYTLQKGNTTYSKDKILKLIDFIHFSYMSEFFTHPIMNFLTEQTMTDTPLEQTMQKLWPIIIEAQNTKLKENPPPNESPGLFKKLLKSNSHIPTLTIQEFYQGSFLFGGTFIKKAKNEFPDDFNQVTLNISKNLENYKRSEEGIVS